TQDSDRLGTSVAIAGDSVFVGAPFEDGSGTDRGAAYVYERDEGSQDNWGQTLKLLAGDAANVDLFGGSVDVSGGSSVGDAAILGAPFEDGAGADRGAAYVFSLKTPNGEYCSSPSECVSGFCIDMMCCDTPCGGGDVTDCIACSQVADGPVDGTCLPRLNGSTCSDGAHCNGTETCASGVCGSSTGDPCLVHLGDPDTDCSESCDETNDLCIAVDPNGSACSDGTFCNGTESCTNGACGTSTGDPCAANVGNLNADCSESCNENADACTANDPDGSQCDDALFCNGTDLCLGGVCLTHAGDPCQGPDNDTDCTETCDDGGDDCEGDDPNGSPCPGGVCQVGVCTTSSGTGGGGGSSSGTGGGGGSSSGTGGGGGSSSGTGGGGGSSSGTGGGGGSSSGTGGGGGSSSGTGGGGGSSSGTGGGGGSSSGTGGGGGSSSGTGGAGGGTSSGTGAGGGSSSGTGGAGGTTSSGAGGGGAGTSSGTGGTGAASSGQAKLEPEGGGGCGCRVASRRTVPLGAWAALAALALALGRRRRP
ncbi:MAG: FG-GAP repeat protein, partial [Deltaproteobacteria bacterium]|nr:FG-GAP repeat protein [Deltaproteobacteria bacterium]